MYQVEFESADVQAILATIEQQPQKRTVKETKEGTYRLEGLQWRALVPGEDRSDLKFVQIIKERGAERLIKRGARYINDPPRFGPLALG